MKKTVLLSIVMVLALSMAISGTIAYLSDTDSDVNVMTLGNVQIDQIELQRKDGIDYKNGGAIADGDELEPFEQGKPLYPAYYSNDISNYTAKTPNDEQFWWGPYVTADVTGNGASNGLWDDKLVGALDKFVFVKNTGKSDCYYRTWLAFECPEGMEYGEGTNKEFMMNVNLNPRFEWVNHGYCTIEGVQYLVMSATYQNVLAAGEISRPSLLQVVMTHNATNEDMELLGDTYEILAFTQAVQTNNFEEAGATVALNAAFGDKHPWGNDVEELPAAVVDSEADFNAAIEAKENIILASDVTLTAAAAVDYPLYVNLNGYTLSTKGLDFKQGGSMENGTVTSNDDTNMVPYLKVSGGKLIMDDVKVEIDDYLNYQASGNRSYGEFTGMEVMNAEATLNDCHITVKNDTYRTWNYVYGLTMNNAVVTMNGGSITVESAGASKTDLKTALCAIGTSTATLNDVTVNAETLGAPMGHLIVNTTDATVSDEDFVPFGGTFELNHIN